jgi:hypothetical protein
MKIKQFNKQLLKYSNSKKLIVIADKIQRNKPIYILISVKSKYKLQLTQF